MKKAPAKLHYAWIICLCGLLLFICNMGLCSNILSVYLPFIEAGGVSDSMGSAILTIRCLTSFAFTFLVDAYYRRLSLRRGILLASLAGVASSLIFSLGGGAPVYYLAAALGGVAYGLGCIYPVSLLLVNWFNTHRGLAVGISSAGSGLATVIFSPVLTALAVHFSLGTAFLVQAGFMLLSALIVYLLVRDTPQDRGMAPFGAEGDGITQEQEEKAQPRALSRYTQWMLALMMLLIGGAGQAFSGHLSVLAISCGYGVKLAAVLLSLHGLVLVGSKFLSGGLADAFGPLRCTALLMLIFVLGCCMTRGMDGVSLLWCYGAVILMGFGASVYNVGPALWAADLVPRAGYPRLMRWFQIFYNLGGILFSAVPGILAERTGEYRSAYLLIAAMMTASLLILLWAYGRTLGRSRRA